MYVLIPAVATELTIDWWCGTMYGPFAPFMRPFIPSPLHFMRGM